MDVDETAKAAEAKEKEKEDAAAKESKDVKIEDTTTGDKDKEKEKKEKEPDFELLQNPSRVMKPQLKVISLNKSSRYLPLKDFSNGGIILMRDTQSDQPENLVETVKAHGPIKEEEAQEPEPPEPFEWTDE